MADHDQHARNTPDHALAALFRSRGEARSAISALHKAKYTHTWLGTTSIGETAGGEAAVTVETGGFFAGTESLVEALVKHGVHGDAARAVEDHVEPGNAVVTLDPKEKSVAEATSIVEAHGGRVAGGLATSTWASQARTAPNAADTVDDVEFEEALFYRR